MKKKLISGIMYHFANVIACTALADEEGRRHHVMQLEAWFAECKIDEGIQLVILENMGAAIKVAHDRAEEIAAGRLVFAEVSAKVTPGSDPGIHSTDVEASSDLVGKADGMITMDPPKDGVVLLLRVDPEKLKNLQPGHRIRLVVPKVKS